MRVRGLVLLATVGLLLGISPRKQYKRDIDDATRKLVIYRGFQTALMLRATYLDAGTRSLIAGERRRLIQPNDTDHTRFTERMSSDNRLYHEVVFAADSGIQDDKASFGDSDASWMIRFFADGREEPLVTIERVRKPTSLHKAIYPQLNQWSDLWIARFERTVTDPKRVSFSVGSGWGHGRIEWEEFVRP
jgi:hypothetical protein